MEKLPNPSRFACQTAMALGGAVVSKPDGEEDHLAVGVLARQLHRVERRVDHAHVAAGGLDGQQVGGRPGHAQHVAEGGEDHLRAAGDGERLVDELERRHADRAAGAMDQADRLGEHAIDARPHQGVRLPAADLHQVPVVVGVAAQGGEESLGLGLAAVLVDEAHGVSSPSSARLCVFCIS